MKSAEAALIYTKPPKTKEESLKYGSLLYKSGHYPAGTSDCFNVGISGGCGVECFVFASGGCEVPEEVSREEIIRFYGEEEAQDILDYYPKLSDVQVIK